MKTVSLSKLLNSKSGFPHSTPEQEKHDQKELDELQLKMLRIQQGIWHQRRRAILLFEGFDAAGKGGTIQRLVESLDPRGYQVYGVGPPTREEQARHYLYRFWTRVPLAGTIAIFDRSWYGRVLVERVEKLTPKHRWKDAYREINEFEAALTDDGIDLVKIFLAIDKKEQLRRFEERLRDPYKQWKLTEDDVEARRKWDDYVVATDKMFDKTNTKHAPWNLLPANDKHHTRIKTLSIVTDALAHHGRWMEGKAREKEVHSLRSALRKLGVRKSSL